MGDAVASKLFTGIGSVHITGTAADEVLSFGTTGGSTLNGGAGDDTITGNDGADVLIGGDGATECVERRCG